MVLPLELQKVKRIAEFATGMSHCQIIFLGQGATSTAWCVTDENNSVIVRMIPSGTNRPTTYQSEFAILRLLRDQGCPVPQPILNNAECPDQLKEIDEPWAVTKVIKGRAIKKNRLTPQVARELGGAIAILHALPITGYGRLAEQKAPLQGLQENHVSGVCARWCWAKTWPFDGCRLEQHCISGIDPHLVDRLEYLEPAILESITQDQVVLTHSDLHGEHIFEQAGNLTGVIDFGVSFISIPAWEVAVMAFYHGWSVTQEMLTGYHPSREVQEFQLKQAQKLAIVVGLYKLSKAIKAQASQEKVVRIRRFIAHTLDTIGACTYKWSNLE